MPYLRYLCLLPYSGVSEKKHLGVLYIDVNATFWIQPMLHESFVIKQRSTGFKQTSR
jgi:hypothetical protein